MSGTNGTNGRATHWTIITCVTCPFQTRPFASRLPSRFPGARAISGILRARCGRAVGVCRWPNRLEDSYLSLPLVPFVSGTLLSSRSLRSQAINRERLRARADNRGRSRWTQDGEGYITYISYHSVMARLAYRHSTSIRPQSRVTFNSGSSGNWDWWAGATPAPIRPRAAAADRFWLWQLRLAGPPDTTSPR